MIEVAKPGGYGLRSLPVPEGLAELVDGLAKLLDLGGHAVEPLRERLGTGTAGATGTAGHRRYAGGILESVGVDRVLVRPRACPVLDHEARTQEIDVPIAGV